ncbi:hypothetical protein ATCV1_z837R [Acanthocystis turfacea chlorella virus 1]|uniref:Uncharacterized protein z837R n=1 Tax=Chlorovirus heliozoae TaxID=322019 RepID=A7KA97_9PHYC|nr:hypothetical protein ATCV1_z837R [Acanthocystis turfacea chlorella virus 1]ABT16971.1 hypothetical protein ATCV1_z837R [Acanthocystis turfacea chlorella virus 1]
MTILSIWRIIYNFVNNHLNRYAHWKFIHHRHPLHMQEFATKSCYRHVLQMPTSQPPESCSSVRHSPPQNTPRKALACKTHRHMAKS